ncbi:lectin-like isoform X2 [Neocloeon triangulifer]|uniref:lectin-like isoform X2 n=1 Tax=Neocloeon triangulifer TaxID=2078957 RepID=UPI00286F2A8F|nr:lectin-like isoform X2 [Neocloeon triangulifer]
MRRLARCVVLLMVAGGGFCARAVADHQEATTDKCTHALKQNWTELSNGKKYFASDEYDNVEWSVAKGACEKSGSGLASIEREEEMQLLLDAFPEIGFHASYWLSASDVGRRAGDFRWGGGPDLPKDSPWWSHDQPSTFRPGRETCVMVLANKLHDLPCSSTHRYLCQLPANCKSS